MKTKRDLVRTFAERGCARSVSRSHVRTAAAGLRPSRAPFKSRYCPTKSQLDGSIAGNYQFNEQQMKTTTSGFVDQDGCPQTKAFTLTELLVVIGTIALLAATLLPALAGVNQNKALGIGCLNNLKQLTLAAQIYGGDNLDNIPVNDGGADAWVQGDVTVFPGVTNVANIYSCELWPYVKAAAIYQCPGDMDLVPPVNLPRVRNYSLNMMMGNNEYPPSANSVHPNIQEHLTFNSVTNPGPSSASFFVDEQSSATTVRQQPVPGVGLATSIDDGLFAVPSGVGTMDTWNSRSWMNVPSSRHGNFGQFSYADGHAGLKKWLEPDTRKLQGLEASSSGFSHADKRQVWLTTYASGSVPGVPW